MLGTKGYMAPEITENKPYDGKSVDLFAAAVILWGPLFASLRGAGSD